ncbi:MAG TPA: hypothetical protein IAC53_07860 [Candidatus Fimenecus excrementigallinarum]|uniref:Stage III sporulation protein AD n=1 Tax=Candidatus Fimenecus excrementigallinarum TaxID=2840816 RepID=A0A9D1II55_9FIRM|nr:hypothetical protein [Candidatus Fimenecus excrementigallinarum]
MLRWIGIALAGLAAVVILKSFRAEYSFLLKITVLLLLGIPAAAVAAQALDAVQALGAQAGISDDMLSLLIKALGVCLITQIASNLCSDCGESALALGVELLGRGVILMMAIPLAASLISWCMAWINT